MGKNTPFWEARWLNGVSHKELAPHLMLQSRFKYRTVQQELKNFGWIKNLGTVYRVPHGWIIILFSTLNEIRLSEVKDKIAWRWTATGDYSASSVHDIQFFGSFPQLQASMIWQVKTEPRKALTADNLMKKNWPCNPDCALCYCILDTNKHILTECNFTKAVWDHYYWKVGGLGASCEMYALYQHLAAVLPLRCALWSSLQPLIEDGFIESWGSQFSFPVPLLSVQQSNQQKRWICMFNRSETLDFDFDYTKSKFIKFCHSAFVVSIKV